MRRSLVYFLCLPAETRAVTHLLALRFGNDGLGAPERTLWPVRFLKVAESAAITHRAIVVSVSDSLQRSQKVGSGGNQEGVSCVLFTRQPRSDVWRARSGDGEVADLGDSHPIVLVDFPRSWCVRSSPSTHRNLLLNQRHAVCFPPSSALRVLRPSLAR